MSYNFKLKPLNAESLLWLRERGFTSDTVITEHWQAPGELVNPRLQELKMKMLEEAGHAVILPSIEEDLHALLKRGQFIDGKGAKKVPGRPSDCHRNSCYLWERAIDKHVLMTGYALSQDGLWRQHSWVYDALFDIIKETTTRRLLYFGFKMTEEEAEEFYYRNT